MQTKCLYLCRTTGDSVVRREARANANNFLRSGAVTQAILSNHTSSTYVINDLVLTFVY